MVELIGVIASLIVSVSFFMNGERRIRYVNLIGSIVFAIYGFLMGSISIVFLNALSIIVNTVKIYKLNKEEISNENNDNPHQ